MNNKIFPEQMFPKNDIFDTYYSSYFYKNYVMTREKYRYQYDDMEDKKGYGRYDSLGSVIYPKQSWLRQHNSTTDIQKNLVFVVDAFNDLKIFYDEMFITDKAVKSSIYTQLIVRESYYDAESAYFKYISELYQLFEKYSINTNNIKNPNSLGEFIQKYILFMRSFLQVAPINRSTYMDSRASSSSINGLRISLDSPTPKISLKDKANLYIGNRDFDRFLKSAARFGFMVDKNKPWCIVADLDSSIMIDYASKYKLNNKSDIIENCYHKAYQADLDNCINLLITFWNNYASRYKISSKLVDSEHCKTTFTEDTKLNQLSKDAFNKFYNLNWQIRFYSYTRFLEEKIKVPQEKFEVIVTDACRINDLYNIDQAILYVNIKLNELIERQKLPDTQEDLTPESMFDRLLLNQVKQDIKEQLRF